MITLLPNISADAQSQLLTLQLLSDTDITIRSITSNNWNFVLCLPDPDNDFPVDMPTNQPLKVVLSLVPVCPANFDTSAIDFTISTCAEPVEHTSDKDYRLTGTTSNIQFK